MPAGTKVHKLYELLRMQGHDKGSAARIAQSKTGLSLATGKPPKSRVHRMIRGTRHPGYKQGVKTTTGGVRG